MTAWLFRDDAYRTTLEARVVTAGTAIEALGIGVALVVCVGALDLVGALAAAVAMMAGRVGANAFLAWQQGTAVRA